MLDTRGTEMRDDEPVTMEEVHAMIKARSPRFTPAGYVGLLTILTETARAHGYAIGLHGSLTRDMDLIAAPWTEEACDGETLVRALAAAIVVDEALIQATPGPAQRPHGRVGWTILLGCGAFIDVSVMPRAGASIEVEKSATDPGERRVSPFAALIDRVLPGNEEADAAFARMECERSPAPTKRLLREQAHDDPRIVYPGDEVAVVPVTSERERALDRFLRDVAVVVCGKLDPDPEGTLLAVTQLMDRASRAERRELALTEERDRLRAELAARESGWQEAFRLRAVLEAAKVLLPEVGELDDDGEFVPVPRASLSGTCRDALGDWPALYEAWLELGHAVDGAVVTRRPSSEVGKGTP